MILSTRGGSTSEMGDFSAADALGADSTFPDDFDWASYAADMATGEAKEEASFNRTVERVIGRPLRPGEGSRYSITARSHVGRGYVTRHDRINKPVAVYLFTTP